MAVVDNEICTSYLIHIGMLMNVDVVAEQPPVVQLVVLV